MIDGGLRAIFRDKLKDLHWQSVETGGTGRGVPDSNYCFAGAEGWVEYKKTKGYSVDLSPQQVGWLTRRARAGGRVRVAVRREHAGGPRKGPEVDEIWMLDGRHAVYIREFGLAVGQNYVLGRWTGGPARWDWLEIRKLLLR